MLTLITQSNLTLSWFEPGFCRRTFAFFGSSPDGVVEHLRSKLLGQNPNNCNDKPTQAHFTLCDDPEALAKIFVLQCSSKVLLTDEDMKSLPRR